ncbi:MAG: adenine deaminase C-terminal domain-containing protein [Pseudomonadota bacterium]
MGGDKPHLTRSSEETAKLMKVAMGESAADLAVVNAKVLNVYTGEILDGYSVCVWDRWIAYVGKSPGDAIGPHTRVIDANGKILIPGFIDGHGHIAWTSTAENFLEYAISGGTTTIVTETLEPYPVGGLEGLLDFLESLKDQPIKNFATAPGMVSTSRTSIGISMEDLKELLQREDIIGLGETYWQGVVQDPEVYLPPLMETLRIRKTLEGHTAGANEKKLMAYLAAGITSCHEPIKADEVLDRLRLGLHVMVREGSVRRDLETISKIKDAGIDLRRLILASDGVQPAELLERGYMEYIVQKAIDCGFDPVEAIRMATLNVAEHFRLDDLIGGIAPGRYADMVLIPDMGTIRAEYVVSNGKVIAQDGKLLVPPRRHTFAPRSLNSIKLKKRLKSEDFAIRAPGHGATARVRVIAMVTDLVTRELIQEVPVTDGEIFADPGCDILKIAAVERTRQPGKIFVGLIQGFGLKSGAMASSGAWDTRDIIVVGARESDMALAVNRVCELQGGTVVSNEGKILEEIPMPVFGIMSQLPIRELNQKIKALWNAVSRLGVPFPNPTLSLVTLTTAAIPFLRICEEGLVNIKDGKTLGLFPT